METMKWPAVSATLVRASRSLQEVEPMIRPSLMWESGRPTETLSYGALNYGALGRYTPLQFGLGTHAVPFAFIRDDLPDYTPRHSQTEQSAWDGLLKDAAPLTRPEVSHFPARAVVIGNSGKGYVGVNVEFKGTTYAHTIHAEQFALALARIHGETGIQKLFTSSSPCGHCRQFILENGKLELPITYFHDGTETWKEAQLQELLPNSFTLAGNEANMFNSPPRSLKWVDTPKEGWESLGQKALEAASRSYSPYTEDTWAGIAIETTDGKVYTGSLLESAAYNPTLPPLQVALIHMISEGKGPQDIKRLVLVEPENPGFSYTETLDRFLKHRAPEAAWTQYRATVA